MVGFAPLASFPLADDGGGATAYAVVLTAGALPIAGQSITPVFAGSIAYTVTLTAASLPITGQTITPVAVLAADAAVDDSFVVGTQRPGGGGHPRQALRDAVARLRKRREGTDS